MKNYIKGILTGVLISVAILAIPALADNAEMLFNQVRINVNGLDKVQWGEDIEFDDGTATPSNILYNGTTYLPMRKLGELSRQTIYWNGDSQTVSMTGKQKDIKDIAEKPDANGNVWKYYTFKVNEYNSREEKYYDVSYLGIKDEARGYERVYIIGSEDIAVTDDAIYFVKLRNSGRDPLSVDSYPNIYGPSAEIKKISFDNTPDTQDGETLDTIVELCGAYIDDEYVYYMWYGHGNSRMYHIATVYNYITGETIETHLSRNTYIHNLKIVPTDENMVSFMYDYETPLWTRARQLDFNKTTKSIEGMSY